MITAEKMSRRGAVFTRKLNDVAKLTPLIMRPPRRRRFSRTTKNLSKRALIFASLTSMLKEIAACPQYEEMADGAKTVAASSKNSTRCSIVIVQFSLFEPTTTGDDLNTPLVSRCLWDAR